MKVILVNAIIWYKRQRIFEYKNLRLHAGTFTVGHGLVVELGLTRVYLEVVGLGV